MSVLTLLILVLAVFRLSRAISQEDGPADLFAWLRGKAGQANWIGRGLHCCLCISFWLSFVATAMVVSPLLWREYVLASLGVAGGAVVVYQVVR